MTTSVENLSALARQRLETLIPNAGESEEMLMATKAIESLAEVENIPARAHVDDMGNPHGTTKEHVKLGLIQNLPLIDELNPVGRGYASTDAIKALDQNKLDKTGTIRKAERLAKEFKIELTGDATGETETDGTGTAQVNVIIRGDRHKHAISQVEDLERQLASKAKSGGSKVVSFDARELSLPAHSDDTAKVRTNIDDDKTSLDLFIEGDVKDTVTVTSRVAGDSVDRTLLEIKSRGAGANKGQMTFYGNGFTTGNATVGGVLDVRGKEIAFDRANGASMKHSSGDDYFHLFGKGSTSRSTGDAKLKLGGIKLKEGPLITKVAKDFATAAADEMVNGALLRTMYESIIGMIRDLQGDTFPGKIVMFAGAIADIPTGYALCNGSGETTNKIPVPDMRNRFVLGAGGGKDPGDKGGSSVANTGYGGDHKHSGYTAGHGLTADENGPHTHGSPQGHPYSEAGSRGDFASGDDMTTKVKAYPRSTSSGKGKPHKHALAMSTGGRHRHSLSYTPPYFALAFIIKL